MKEILSRQNAMAISSQFLLLPKEMSLLVIARRLD
jgi:hypothetical protein